MTQTISQVYDLLRQSEMNDWVGGSDPELVGDACERVLRRYLHINPFARLLDFGCGVGRVTLSVLKHHPEVGHITGFDIMPQVIQFCESHIATSFAKTSFQLIGGTNDHYDQFIEAANRGAAKSHAQLRAEYGGKFSSIFAFSVFTHVELEDLRALLSLLSALVQPGGHVLITAFVLTPTTRKAIRDRSALFPFANADPTADGDIFVADHTDRLAFIAFDHALIEQAAFDAGLVIHQIEYGSWAGTIPSPNLQDTIVCLKPAPRSAPIPHVPGVPRRERPGVANPLQAAPNLPALLRLDGETFVRAAYATVLDRLPDSAGLKHYVEELRAGVPKLTIVSNMRNSDEGRRANRSIPGYRRAWLQSRIPWWRGEG
jgi:SAM-dependent methyltransferase